MRTSTRRASLCILIVVAVFWAAERRLSDGMLGMADEPLPGSWKQVQHGSEPAANGSVGRRAAGCPMVISLDPGSQYAFTPVARGVAFDIDGNGDLDQVSWTEASSDLAFLALDEDGDGRITNGRELIGGHRTSRDRNGPSALLALAADALQGERRSTINVENPLFFKLLLWTDTNHDGRTDAAEMRPASDVVSAIGLGFSRQHLEDANGNESRFRGFVHVRTAPGLNRPMSADEDVRRVRRMYEVCLRQSPVPNR